jgi:hypothetical protein
MGQHTSILGLISVVTNKTLINFPPTNKSSSQTGLMERDKGANQLGKKQSFKVLK